MKMKSCNSSDRLTRTATFSCMQAALTLICAHYVNTSAMLSRAMVIWRPRWTTCRSRCTTPSLTQTLRMVSSTTCLLPGTELNSITIGRQMTADQRPSVTCPRRRSNLLNSWSRSWQGCWSRSRSYCRAKSSMKRCLTSRFRSTRI